MTRFPSPPAPRHRARLVLASLAAVPLAGCGGGASATPSADAPVAVTVAPAVPHAGQAPVLASGLLAAKEEVSLAFTIGGVVSRIAVESGRPVRAGEVLAELADDEIGAAVRKAREGQAKAQRDLARVRQLFVDSAATRAQLDDATTAADVAAADVRAAEFNARHATIVAPADGIVLRRGAERGELVQPGQPVVVVRTGRRGIIVRAGLADREALAVTVGDAAEVTVPAAPGRSWRGRVAEIAAAPSPTTGAYDVEVAVAGAASLPSGLVAEVAILPRRGPRGLVAVPAGALLEADGDSAAVFVVDAADAAHRRTVRVARLDGAQALLGQGVAAGERVVAAGAAYLADGARVRIVTGDAAGRPR